MKKIRKKNVIEEKNDQKYWLGRELSWIGSGLSGETSSFQLIYTFRQSLQIFLIRDILNIIYSYLDLYDWKTTINEYSKWSCYKCTYINLATMLKCVICSSQKK